MDLTKAEAVGNLLMAQTKKAQQASLAQLEGKLEEKINNILNKILNLRIQCELAIDFIEDEVPIIEDSELHEKLNIIHNDLDLLERSAHDGMIIHEGLKVCLIGEPNVGKSSLFNKILDMDRAIVSDIPGTTRDYIEEAISLQGNLIRFFDTAGIRQSEDIIEKMGIERSNQIIEQADLIFLLLDAQIINENPTINHFNEYLISLKSKLIMNDKTLKIIPIINKADLLNTEASNYSLITKSCYAQILKLTVSILSHLSLRVLCRLYSRNRIGTDFQCPPISSSIQSQRIYYPSHKYLKNGHRHRIYCFRPCLCQQSSRRNNWQNHY